MSTWEGEKEEERERRKQESRERGSENKEARRQRGKECERGGKEAAWVLGVGSRGFQC